MKHSLRRFIAVSAAALTMISALPARYGKEKIIRAVTASAASSKDSGVKGLAVQVSSNATLYFYFNKNSQSFEVCGSKITGDNVYVEIPDTVSYNGKKYTVTSIFPHAFDDQTNLGEIRGSSEHITSIGQGAFYGCSNLKEVYFANGGGYSAVEYIGASAFNGCSSLNNIIFASQTDEIGAHAFWDCTSLISIDLYDVKTLGNAAFYNCSGADKIDLSRSQLTNIPNHAFWGCKNAKEVHLPETVTEIGVQSFAGCTNFTTVNIPDNVTTIGSAAFMSCDSLRNVLMSEGIIYVGDHAFFLCPNMKYFVSKNPNAFLGDYSVGWHLLDNGKPVTNDDFVVWSTGNGRVKKYAANNGLTYHNISEAASIATERYADYKWRTPNGTFGEWSVKGYDYYFDTAHIPYSNGYLGKKNEGVCSGMATVSALTSQGYLSVSDFSPRGTTILSIGSSDIDRGCIPVFTRSYVTTVWANQNLYSHDYEADWDTNHFGKEMIKYAENITYGADTAIFNIGSTRQKSGHSMVCFGLEFRDYASDKNNARWNGWDARFLIYDMNNHSYDSAEYFYVNFTDGSWYSSLFSKYGYDTTKNRINMTHSYDKMVAAYNYGMTADEFFDAIKLK
ncbi:leucine-rich repeat domain-containing protein [Ruminococcus flavefaciens]|uniref:Leucine rich repeat-containing protein n=1 Tax=Ruminococcus flavefaciens 007c TaxID=1341157 RepID=W7UF64_RUMFL|nr:leucine-rich repeat domain-containing protein [Ruminococcus flavefaciens]EWM52573.1 hypothetical protein RF007C_08535 [Ruminococcus flavefaciens 007c]